ncbi:MAG: sugar ABC transporter permease [Elusimicrobia bacterium RIFCSPHIGHO2_02_FULL_61_10]|nr:MAG: sugar ABC transporter permease [Candidatus Lindowbacteria bacterium RIFCSPLOWO2_12_FULL_62_27]OGH61906.1 MAG: sugar ABC transporter permease [Candidatus Lindowbacteria bacterium RIFCSPLOWO2_02_FULL_62_12]OGS18103.1 MAG: sugar ABC transporter permease [Elusimicrobia bacterium RIFCSPHIGHO2_02_FULL_61_10]
MFPALLLLSVFLLIPIMASLIMSLTNWDIYSLMRLSNLNLVGFDNYRKLLTQDEVFKRSVLNTFVFVLVAVPLTISVALGMALVVNSALLKFKAFFRTGFFIPVITTMVAVAVIWRWLYNPQFGLFNLGLEKLGLQPQNWLGEPHLALPCLILMAVWKNFGYNMIIFIAGLQAIPHVLYEASDIDGVNPWQRFRHITLPMLKPSMIFVCITTVIGYFQFFAEPYIMTEGGPNNATNSIVLYTYNHAFKFYNMGYASAISYVLFMMTLVFSLAQIAYAKKSEA